jgi:DNA-binding PadR family transcriptional regulator
MERELLLLGLLRSEAMHGYQLNEFIDSHLGATVHLKKPTAYRLLNKMVDDGWITYTEEREGNRPPRRIFALAAKGEAAFQRLLRECLAKYEPVVFSENIGLLFLDALPAEEATELLRERRARVEAVQDMARDHQVHGGGASLLLQHQARHLATELEWLDEVIEHLESSLQHPDHEPEGHCPSEPATDDTKPSD